MALRRGNGSGDYGACFLYLRNNRYFYILSSVIFALRYRGALNAQTKLQNHLASNSKNSGKRSVLRDLLRAYYTLD